MGSSDDLDELLELGSTRPAEVTSCVDPPAVPGGQLLAYRQGRLGHAEQEQLEGHLIACPYCRDAAARLRQPRPRRWPQWAALAAAVAAVLILLFARAPITYSVTDWRGQIAELRSDAPKALPRIYRPESQVGIKIEPGGRTASSIRVFRIDGEARTEIAPEIEAGVAGVFWIKGSGRTLFGDQAGSKRLVIVAGDWLTASEVTFDADYRID